MRDALDLGPRVLAGVEPRPVVAGALLPEVEPADKLADDQEVDPLRARGSQVRVDAELLPEREESLLRSDRGTLELEQPDGAQEHRIGGPTRSERLVG